MALSEIAEGALRGLAAGIRGYTTAQVAVAKARTEEERQRRLEAFEQARLNLQSRQLQVTEQLGLRKQQSQERQSQQDNELKREVAQLRAGVDILGQQSDERVAGAKQKLAQSELDQRTEEFERSFDEEARQFNETLDVEKSKAQASRDTATLKQQKADAKEIADRLIAENEDATTQERKFRQEFIKLGSPYIKVSQAVQRARSIYPDAESIEAGSAQKDIALIFMFMKAWDEESVVREGEQAVAASARGLFESAGTLVDRVRSGIRLSSGQRKRMIEAIELSFRGVSKLNDQTISELRSAVDIARSRNPEIDTNAIFVDLGIIPRSNEEIGALLNNVTDDPEFSDAALISTVNDLLQIEPRPTQAEIRALLNRQNVPFDQAERVMLQVFRNASQ